MSAIDERYVVGAREAAIKAAKKSGYKVTFGKPNLLLLDIDSELQYVSFQRVLLILTENDELHYREIHWARSKSGGIHIHLEIYGTLAVKERCMLQAMLGSDCIREALGLVEADLDLEPFLIDVKTLEPWTKEVEWE